MKMAKTTVRRLTPQQAVQKSYPASLASVGDKRVGLFIDKNTAIMVSDENGAAIFERAEFQQGFGGDTLYWEQFAGSIEIN